MEHTTMDPEALVREAEAAYQAQDADRIMDLFDPEILVYWDGKQLWETHEDVREHHAEAIADLPEFDIQKSLRAASGDTITVEWRDSWVDAEGTRGEGFGAEFWTMHDGRLREWHVYYETYDHDEMAGGEFLTHHPAGEG
ncbi:nuclear transport factor 2 family protein [Salinirussus salinus]|uniref:nuclear transport factor 2 family protein n=1 Tax=Salinirussus salinus TaxID=1198300 RepID=UPI00135A7291|nr:nuclear transport factor 2 family protein [Salinirussus salinus]